MVCRQLFPAICLSSGGKYSFLRLITFSRRHRCRVVARGKTIRGKLASAECYCTKLKCVSKLLIIKEIVVEATGVEPASENVTGQETTCLFAFMPQALGVSTLPRTFAAHAQNGQETLAASLRS